MDKSFTMQRAVVKQRTLRILLQNVHYTYNNKKQHTLHYREMQPNRWQSCVSHVIGLVCHDICLLQTARKQITQQRWWVFQRSQVKNSPEFHLTIDDESGLASDLDRAVMGACLVLGQFSLCCCHFRKQTTYCSLCTDMYSRTLLGRPLENESWLAGQQLEQNNLEHVFHSQHRVVLGRPCRCCVLQHHEILRICIDDSHAEFSSFQDIDISAHRVHSRTELNITGFCDFPVRSDSGFALAKWPWFARDSHSVAADCAVHPQKLELT